MSTLQNGMKDNLREWDQSAPYWRKHASIIRQMFAPVTAALIEEAGIIAGQTVLDVAGGAGEPSLTIARVVGSAGSVMYTDAIAKMVDAAESEAQRSGLTNIQFRQCGADALPFTGNSFDAVVSRLGIMFFPDPLAAVQEMLRVAKPGGTLTFVVWGMSEANPFSYVVTNVISRHVPTAPPGTAVHDAFSFAEPGKLAGVLEQAGAVNIHERLLKFQIAAPISFEQFWEVRSETSGTLRDKLATLSKEVRDLIKMEVAAASQEFFPNNSMNFPALMLIVSGMKPT
jgi:ubiquinone/menaquinone biosynthesis C-methylase UbiE